MSKNELDFLTYQLSLFLHAEPHQAHTRHEIVRLFLIQ